MEYSGGGWSLVWKHSYREVTITADMYYHSSYFQPCLDIEAGWCNVPQKIRFEPDEMMIVAYHNKRVGYAYKGTFNRNIDYHWTGGTLLNPQRIEDHCKNHNTLAPYPHPHSAVWGIAFTKSPRGKDDVNYSDTIEAISSGDDRWEECKVKSHISPVRDDNVQMTMAIYVR